jgi:hypothetical protein
VSVSFLPFGRRVRVKGIIPHAAPFLQDYTAITIGAWIHNNTQASMLLVLACHFSITFSVTFFGQPSTTAARELSSTLINTGIQVLTAIAIVVSAGSGAKRLVRG